TTFCVALPIMPFTRDAAEADEGADQSAADHWPLVLPDGQALAGVTLLVVDDHQPTLDLLTSVLRHCAANVVAATNAAEGYALLSSVRPDVLLSDIGMPEEDGFAFIDKIRRLPPERGGNTPAIALTAYVRDDDEAKVLAGGFQAYLAKPADPLALVAAIRELVTSRHGVSNGLPEASRGLPHSPFGHALPREEGARIQDAAEMEVPSCRREKMPEGQMTGLC
ncbi:MAG: multi-sensor hybrid histidine kinase, partial [Acidobacteria bacterium]|nr:multi-sensor hybrid histidine kinase [Acidobacteriota bacterium]